jgi:hypothetical protein
MKCNHSHELTDTIDPSYTDDGSLQESLVQTLDISQRRRYQEHSLVASETLQLPSMNKA